MNAPQMMAAVESTHASTVMEATHANVTLDINLILRKFIYQYYCT